MRCPWCKSEELARSYRTDAEELLRYLWPRSPFRCRECGKRSWHIEDPFRSKNTRVAWGLWALVLALPVVIYMLAVARSPAPPVALSPLPALPPVVSTYPLPVPEMIEVPTPESPQTPVSPDHAAAAPGPVDESAQPAENPASPAGPPQPVFAPEGLVRVQIDPGSAAWILAAAPTPAGAHQPTGTVPAAVPPVPQASVASAAPAHETAVAGAPQSSGAGSATLPTAEAVQPPPMPPDAQAPVSAVGQDHDGVRELKGIRSTLRAGELELSLLADGPITDYRSFYLEAPPRLVIDLNGDWRDLAARPLRVPGKRLRIGHHPDKLRIVMELKSEATPPPRFVQSDDGLTVMLPER